MPNVPSLDESEIRTGRIVDSNTIVLLLEFHDLAQRDVPHAGIAIWRRGQDWIRARVEFNGIDVTRGPKQSEPRFVIIGDTGKYAAAMDGPSVYGIIVEEDALASGNVVHGSVVAVGILGRIYRMTNPHAWEKLGNPPVSTNLEAICECSSGGFMTCGWSGLVAYYDGNRVEQLESGTNVILTSITCDEHGEIFACGQNGIILRGTKDSLKPLDLGDISEDFWSIAKFQGKVYVSSITSLYELTNDEALELVKFDGEEIPTTFYRLDTYEDSFMLSIGQKDAVLFDGREWTRIL